MLSLLASLCLLIASFGPASAARGYEVTDRWSKTATDGNTGSQGNPVTVTWGFVPDGTTISGSEGSSGSNLLNFLDANIGTNLSSSDLTDRPWFTIFDMAFTRLGEVSGVTFVYEPNNTTQAISSSIFSPSGQLGVRPDVRIGGHSIDGQTGQNTLAYNYFPDISDMVIDTDNVSFFSNANNAYRGFRNVIMHEAGHGLGFNHIESNNSGMLMEPIISTSFDGPQLDDILALHRNYGDAWEKNGGNNTSSTSVDLGGLNGNASLAIGTLGDSTFVSASQTDFLSIDDNSDTDFFKFTLSSTLEVTLDLTPRGATYNEAPQGGTQTILNTKALSDLTLTLLASNGSTVLDLANANGLGGAETIKRTLDIGTYLARVTGSANDVQLYGLDISGIRFPANLHWTGQQSGVWDVNTTKNFNNLGFATVFNDADQVTFDDTASSYAVSLAEDVQPESVTVNTTATYMFTGPGAIVEGSLTLTGGGTLELANNDNTYSGNTDVLDGTLVITGNANAMVSAITIALGSNLVMDSSDASGMGSTFHVEDGGTLQIGTLASNANVFPDQPNSILNDGDIRILDDETLSNVIGTGQIIAEHETTFLGDNGAFDGSVIVNSGGIIDVDDPNAFGTAVLGTIINDGGSVLIDLSATFDEPFDLAGEGTGNGALRVGGNSVVELRSEITLSGTIAKMQVDSGSTLQVSASVISIADGTLNLQVADEGQAMLAGSLELGAGGLVKQGEGVAHLLGLGNFTGPTDVESGTLFVSGRTGAGDTTVRSGATLMGTGTIAGNLIVENDATIYLNSPLPQSAMPVDPNQPLLVAGEYIQLATATLKILLQDNTEFELLTITGSASLDGVLDVKLSDGFSPSLGTVFEILTASGGVNNSFAAVVFPDLGTLLTMDVIYSSDKVKLAVVPALPGDFDVDGDVDGSDFLTWQRGGSPESFSAEDLTFWQSNFGAQPLVASSVAVPEPSTWVLLSLLEVGGMLAARRRIS